MFTHLRPEHRQLATPYTSEEDIYGSGLIEHDMQVGQVLDALKKLGVLDDTIVIYTTDNGAEHSGRSHGGTTPFRGEKMTTYEGGVRVPTLVRWPGHIPAGRVLNGIQTHMDLFTTLAAAAGVPDVAATHQAASASSTSTASTTSITGRASRPRAHGRTSSTTTSPS